MPALPAICETCGTVFPSSFVVENVAHATFVGNRSGPCPACGGMGRVPDGIYNIIGQSIEILQQPGRTRDELVRLAQILTTARSKETNAADLRTALTTEVPALKSIADALPTNRTELYAFIAILLAALTLIINTITHDSAPKIELNQVINVFNQQAPSSPPTPRAAPTGTAPVRTPGTVGRNDPCPCGSGKKYKKCYLHSP